MSRETYDVTIPTLIALNAAFPQGVWLRRNVGGVKIDDRFIKFGHAGMSDIHGIYCGRAFEIETKARRGKLLTSQENWQKAVERAGGCFLQVREPHQAIAGVKAYLAGRGV